MAERQVMMASGEMREVKPLITPGPKKDYVGALEFAKTRKGCVSKVAAIFAHPNREITERVDRRRIRILSGITITHFIIILLLHISQLATTGDASSLIASIPTLVLILVGYVFSRTKYVDLATWANIVGAILMPTVWGGWFGSSSVTDPASIMVWYLLPPAVSACTQKWNSMIAAGVLNIVIFYMTSSLAAIDLTYAPHVHASIIIQTAFLLVIAYINKRDLRQLDLARRGVPEEKEDPLQLQYYLKAHYLKEGCFKKKLWLDPKLIVILLLHPSKYIMGGKDRRRARMLALITFAMMWVELYYLEFSRISEVWKLDMLGHAFYIVQFWCYVFAYVGSRTKLMRLVAFVFSLFPVFQFVFIGGFQGQNVQYSSTILAQVAQIFFFSSMFLSRKQLGFILASEFLAALYIPQLQTNVTYTQMASSIGMLVAVVGYHTVWYRDLLEAEMQAMKGPIDVKPADATLTSVKVEEKKAEDAAKTDEVQVDTPAATADEGVPPNAE